MKTTKEMIEEFCEENDLQFYDDYSGRGILGKTCVGIVCNDIVGTLYDLTEYIIDNYNMTLKDIKKILSKYCFDNMGLQYIIYFPNIQ